MKMKTSRYITMATVHTNLYAKVPYPCLSCKNSIEMPCEGCEHEDEKIKAVEKHKKLIDMTLKAPLKLPRDVGHDSIERIMEKKHKLEELADEETFDSVDQHRRGMIEAYEECISIIREVIHGDVQRHD